MFTKFTRLAAVAVLSLSLTLATLRPVAANAVGGSKEKYDTVSARTADVYHIAFYGDETARVAASGNGDIDIYVYDSDGDLVAYDDDYDDTPVCSWVPDYRQNYTIKIVNNEHHSVRYYMKTN